MAGTDYRVGMEKISVSLSVDAAIVYRSLPHGSRSAWLSELICREWNAHTREECPINLRDCAVCLGKMPTKPRGEAT